MGESAKYFVPTGDKKKPAVAVEVESLGGDSFRVTVDGVSRVVDACVAGGGVTAIEGSRVISGVIEEREGRVLVSRGGRRASFEILPERMWRLMQVVGLGAAAAKPELKSPMSGKVVLTRVVPGQSVDQGQTLLIIEAMKMENEIRALGPATVKEVRVKAGDVVNPGDVLIEFNLDQV